MSASAPIRGLLGFDSSHIIIAAFLGVGVLDFLFLLFLSWRGVGCKTVAIEEDGWEASFIQVVAIIGAMTSTSTFVAVGVTAEEAELNVVTS